jgi:hypothetical protein
LHFAYHGCDAPGPSPGFLVTLAINAPVRLLQEVWRNHILRLDAWNNTVPWDSAALIVAVGLLWYWVARNIRSWQRRRAVLMFSWLPARFLLDAFLVIYGALFGLIGMVLGYEAVHAAPSNLHGSGCFGPNLWNSLLPSITTAVLYLSWAVVLIFFFGRDFLHASRRIVA